MQIFPIRNDADYERAIKEVEPYFDNPPPEGDPLCDVIDVMLTLIDAYQWQKHPIIDNTNAIDAIRFYMDQNGLTPKDLVPCIGRINRVYEILSGKRKLTLPMIRRLHDAFGIPLESLVKA